jgi:transcriptional regulator with XRE-family HTH domain
MHATAIVAANIKALRHMKRWTQRRLADEAGIASVKMIEAGRTPGRVDTLDRIADALGVPLAKLFCDPPLTARER